MAKKNKHKASTAAPWGMLGLVAVLGSAAVIVVQSRALQEQLESSEWSMEELQESLQQILQAVQRLESRVGALEDKAGGFLHQGGENGGDQEKPARPRRRRKASTGETGA